MIIVKDEEGHSLTEVEIRDQMMTLLVAGFETTSTALSWAIYWTSYIKDVRTKLLNEINSSDTTELFSKTSFPYLNAVCSEALRIYPPAVLGFRRIVKKPIEIANYYFEPGTILTPCIYLLHQREEIYPHPQQFEPERFLTRTFKQHEYIPFGGGQRKCLGYALALLEMKLVLLTIFKNWEIKLADESSPEVPASFGVTIFPKNQVKVTLKKRN
jgi:cytochrome P450 family 110